MTTKIAAQRNFGLDIIRSFAIIMVLIGHVIPDNTANKFLLSFAYLFRGCGVELFFVLSGFLIGKILINLFQKEDYKLHIKTFYVRRWLRTLPLYYSVLLIYLILYKFAHPDLNIFSGFYLKYFVFIQNFDIRHFHFFNQSWSLSVEEWFYLLLPLIFLVLHTHKIKPEDLYKILLKIIIVIVITKFFYIWAVNPTMDFGVRRFIPLRYDSLLVGVLFACLKINNKEIYDKFLTPKAVFISLFLITILIFYQAGNYLFKALYYSILSFSLIIPVIFFENNGFINQKLPKYFLIKTFFEKTSIYSYSIYLFHLAIMFSYDTLFKNFYQSPLLIAAYFLTLYLTGALVYRYFEKPIMNLREKF